MMKSSLNKSLSSLFFYIDITRYYIQSSKKTFFRFCWGFCKQAENIFNKHVANYINYSIIYLAKPPDQKLQRNIKNKNHSNNTKHHHIYIYISNFTILYIYISISFNFLFVCVCYILLLIAVDFVDTKSTKIRPNERAHGNKLIKFITTTTIFQFLFLFFKKHLHFEYAGFLVLFFGFVGLHKIH